ncbi:hypothetical protein QLG13_28550 (plasmid) [Rhodococcus aetherivorans]|uniref:hypothetical protein n=1 Tax=Rhodococcus TaxID=1827 RepID=UPI0002D21D62|nr:MULTISPECIES: hypothetical protein [Rhodococcus]QIX53796.1 hypothetical protein HFP48_29815 [Rhodococcus sp. DMU1]CCW15097.1 hypothetical protein EBESD8_56690 [Rhodococcus aetherivorans]
MTGRPRRRPRRRQDVEILAPDFSSDEVETLLRQALRRAWAEGYHASNVDACFNAEFGTDRRSVNPYDEPADQSDQRDTG